MPMPPTPPVPGWGGTLPWNSPPAAPAPTGQAGMPPPPGGQPPPGPPPGMPPQGGQPQSNPLAGLPPMGPPGAPPGPPQGALGAPAGQGNNISGMAPQQPMAMARGGAVPHIARPQHAMRIMPRSEPTFGHILQSAGLRKYADGGPVRPIVLSGRQLPGYKKGGMVSAAQGVQGAGRYGDSVLVHVNPQEFQEMKAKFGPHTVNPETGLPEFGWFGDLLKIVAPIAALAIPGVGEFLAPALESLGLGATTAGIVGSALAGAGLGAITGGGKGALIGGITGGVGSAFGPSISEGLQGLGVGSQTAGALVNAGLGAGGAAAAGGNPLMGAAMAGGLSYLAPQLTSSIQGLGSIAGPSAGTDPLSAAVGNTPSVGAGAPPQLDAAGTPLVDNAPTVATAPTSGGGGGSGAAGAAGSNSLMSKALPALMLLSLAGGLGGKKTPEVITTPPPASNAPAYFNQPFSPATYNPQINPAVLAMLKNNPALYASQGGAGFYQPGTTGFTFPQATQATSATPAMAKGGALKMAASHVSGPPAEGPIKGPGDGVSDSIPARLAKDEHVLDSDFVGLLGNGSSDAGHEKLEKWKADVRRKKRSAPAKTIPPKTGALAASFAAAQRKK